MTAAGFASVTAGSANQNIQCYLESSKSILTSAYFSVDPQTPQQSFTVIDSIAVSGPERVGVACWLGTKSSDAISAQASLMAVNVG